MTIGFPDLWRGRTAGSAPVRPPLEGRLVWVTGARKGEALARILERHGARPSVVSTLASRPDEGDGAALRAVRAVLDGEVGTAVFLTGIGVRALIASAGSAGLGQQFVEALGSVRVVARGAKARSALRGAGVRVDHEPDEPTTRGLLQLLPRLELHGQAVLIQLYGREQPLLESMVRELGARPLTVPLYRFGAPEDEAPVREWIDRVIRGEVYAVTFTSSPAVLGMFAVADCAGLTEALVGALRRHVVAAIGPATSETLDELGVPPRVVPAAYTQPALAEALAAHAAEDPTSPQSLPGPWARAAVALSP